jgi:5-hydroxytryptamine receptor 1
VDRYWAVNRVDYIHNRSAGRILAMIAASWGVSVAVCTPPLFDWRTPDVPPSGNLSGLSETANMTWSVVADDDEECLISQDWGYTVFSTVCAFYLPLVFMMIIYASIYRTARTRIRKKQFMRTLRLKQQQQGRAAPTGAGQSCGPDEPTLITTTTDTDLVKDSVNVGSATTTTLTVLLESPPTEAGKESAATDQERQPGGGPVDAGPAAAQLVDTPTPTVNGGRGSWLDLTRVRQEVKPSPKSVERRAREKRNKARERKAARTLGIITGSFIVCWLPFFTLALVRPFCGTKCHYPPLLVSVIGWLGYFNSLLNPVIYTIFNPDFRSAFRKILFGKYRNRR